MTMAKIDGLRVGIAVKGLHANEEQQQTTYNRHWLN
jgi:hypothetical protein